MGNKIDDKNNDEFIKAVSQMKKSRNDYPVQKVSTHLEQKYRDHMLETLRKQEMSKTVKKLLADCIDKKIKKQDLTSTIAVLNSLRANNAQQILSSSVSQGKAANQTKYVVVKFNQKQTRLRTSKDNKDKGGNGEGERQSNQYMSIREEDTLQGRIKYTGQFICKEMNKNYHPFRILCKRFTDILYTYQQNQKPAQTEQQFQLKQQMLRKSVKQFALYASQGILGVYRKWIIEYTGLEDKKYDKWTYSLCLNQMWGVNDGLLAIALHNTIKKIRVPLKIDLQTMSACSALGVIHPKDFAIDAQLQIQGHYFSSIFNMSTLTQKKKPNDILKQLQAIKNSICIDVDTYHKLEQKGQIFQINGDNIMGIVAYILSRLSDKITQISIILLFLKVIYGDGIYYNMDTSSYMYSTICGAIQYLESRKFQVMLAVNQNTKTNTNVNVNENTNTNTDKQLISQQILEKQLKDTSCVSSSFVSIQVSVQGNNKDKGEDKQGSNYGNSNEKNGSFRGSGTGSGIKSSVSNNSSYNKNRNSNEKLKNYLLNVNASLDIDTNNQGQKQ